MSEVVVVQILQDAIDRAIEKDSAHCIVAEALRQTLPNASHVAVDLQTVRWTENGWRHVALTPPHAQRIILDFDQGFRSKPCTIRLRTIQRVRSSSRDNREETIAAVLDGHKRMFGLRQAKP